jgi:20S proteasome alpha/beta subunit
LDLHFCILFTLKKLCVFIYLGCAMSGLIADSRTLIDRARVEAQVKIKMS